MNTSTFVNFYSCKGYYNDDYKETWTTFEKIQYNKNKIISFINKFNNINGRTKSKVYKRQRSTR